MTRLRVLHPRRQGTDGEAALTEALALAEALGVEVVGGTVVPLSIPVPATLFGSGKVAEIGAQLAEESVEVAVINHPLTPVQQRNLERAWKVKVLDRTGLILEIFGERAQTREGVLQVELAHLSYQKSRLVRSWTHLERQRGGSGFMGGPGERQIEADRRAIDEHIARLRRQLEKVVRTRSLHRAQRKRVPDPVVALVGYTNAGKSTLFNRLTSAEVLAEDMLFATLDPTMRRIGLPSGRHAVLSDTVGFISDLPVQLVAAFRATLEEVLEADLVIHVRDIAHPQTAEQAEDVMGVLEKLGLPPERTAQMIELRNKIDLLDEDARAAAQAAAARDGALAISAVTGEGVAQVLEEIERRLFPRRFLFDFAFGHEAGQAIAWLHAHSDVVARQDGEDGVSLCAEMTEKEYFQFQKAFGSRYSLVSRADAGAA